MDTKNGHLTKEVLQKLFETETGKDYIDYFESYICWLENRCISFQNTIDVLNLQRKRKISKTVKKGDCDCGNCKN